MKNGTMGAASPKCSCGRKMAAAPLQRHETVVARRTCPGCRARWQFTIKYSGKLFGGDAHMIEGTCIADARRKES